MASSPGRRVLELHLDERDLEIVDVDDVVGDASWPSV
jgi:hypothetical protein